MLLQLVKKKIKEFSMSGVVKIEIAESAETLKELLKQAVTRVLTLLEIFSRFFMQFLCHQLKPKIKFFFSRA
jgi:hypothetical protein